MNDYLTEDEARSLYGEGDSAHDFDHVLRVVRMAVRLAQAEGANERVVRLAALLHDLPTGARLDHEAGAADFAERLLRERGLPADESLNVAHCIRSHRWRQRDVLPQTPEARCLFDADKLDAMGAIGVARAFAYAGAHRNRLWLESAEEVAQSDAPQGSDYTPVHEYVFKLRHLLDALHTPTARRLGAERHEAMRAFFLCLDAELDEDAQTGGV